jgi:hypothetical protein
MEVSAGGHKRGQNLFSFHLFFALKSGTRRTNTKIEVVRFITQKKYKYSGAEGALIIGV